MKTAPADALNNAARAVRQAQENASYAGATARSDAHKSRDFAIRAKNDCETAINFLLAAGAERPPINGVTPPVDTLPLHLLDTPAARRYLAALEAAAEAGADLDRERGWTDASGEPTGYGETLAGMVLAMKTQIFGLPGKE